MKRVDTRLYALLDPETAGGYALADLARQIAPYVTLIQLRDKESETREMIARARDVKAALSGTGVPLLINDRVDVALAVDADGVHLGQTDMDPADARRLFSRSLGRDAIIGITVKTIAQVEEAPVSVIDYMAIGGVFATTSKASPGPALGISGLRAMCAALHARAPQLASVAIAGINRTNAAEVIGTGCGGVAVISAIACTPEPAVAARELRELVDKALAARTKS